MRAWRIPPARLIIDLDFPPPTVSVVKVTTSRSIQQRRAGCGQRILSEPLREMLAQELARPSIRPLPTPNQVSALKKLK
jgi:hypothetical protein